MFRQATSVVLSIKSWMVAKQELWILCSARGKKNRRLSKVSIVDWKVIVRYALNQSYRKLTLESVFVVKRLLVRVNRLLLLLKMNRLTNVSIRNTKCKRKNTSTRIVRSVGSKKRKKLTSQQLLNKSCEWFFCFLSHYSFAYV